MLFNTKPSFHGKTFFALIFLLYLVPSFIQFEYTAQKNIAGIHIGLPFTQSGDEPHYYITLYSLVNDHDFFLTNNYDNAFFRNGSDLGLKRFDVSDRHTRLFDSINKTIINIPFVNSTHLNISYVPSEGSDMKEISGHPTGLPFFAFLFLWPFRHTTVLEHLSIYLTLLFSLLGIYAFYELMIFYHNDERKAQLFTIVLVLGTQYWHYSKTFWAEPYLASFLAISWYLIVVKKSSLHHFVSGFLLGFGFLMKYPFLLAILPFYIYFLLNSLKNKKIEYAQVISFSVPLAFCFASILYLNYFFTGNILAFNQAGAVYFVNPLKGMFNWLFNPVFGLLTYAPILIIALFGIRNFWKKNKIHCITTALLITLSFLFWTAYGVTQTGAGGYSARYLVPLIAFFVLFCSFSNWEKSRILSVIFYVLLIVSFVIQFLASFAYPAFIGYSIFTSLEKIVTFIMKIF